MAQHEAACHREACDARHHVRYRRAFHPDAGTNATPPMSTALAAMFTAFIARLARITSAPRA